MIHLAWVLPVILGLILVIPSIRVIGPMEVGLVVKKFGVGKLSEDNPIAFDGEAGYQADLLMPGWRWKFWIVYSVRNYPWVQVPAGEIGVIIAQVGEPLPIGAKSAVYKDEFGMFQNLREFVGRGGQKGVQRPVLPPGTLAPYHPAGFLIITKSRVYGRPIDPTLMERADKSGVLSYSSFGLEEHHLNVVTIELPQGDKAREGRKATDVVGIVTTLEGEPLSRGDIASRIGGYDDLQKMEESGADDSSMVEAILGTKNTEHNNYQDFQAFLQKGGKIGLQHDPLLYGAFLLNPFLVRVEIVPMLVVEQGEVAVIKAYVGLASADVSGEEFKYGTLVKPGHKGIWSETLRTGKYPINPHCYEAVIVPTYILTLNWATNISEAHKLDSRLSSIEAKSVEGFVFRIDLQVQIHIADTMASRVISMVGTIQNLVDEVLQAAVGNHFRDKLQSMPAVRFIETRQKIQEEAFDHISKHLKMYEVEIKGVYIQDVVFPQQLVQVLTDREIANQEILTYQKQEAAQQERVKMEKTLGTADMQKDLARSQVDIDIRKNEASARKAQADGEAYFVSETGRAEGEKVKAVGLAQAEAYRAQVEALGQVPTAAVNMVNSLSERQLKFVPDILVSGGSSMDGLAASLMAYLADIRKRAQSTGPE